MLSRGWLEKILKLLNRKNNEVCIMLTRNFIKMDVVTTIINKTALIREILELHT